MDIEILLKAYGVPEEGIKSIKNEIQKALEVKWLEGYDNALAMAIDMLKKSRIKELNDVERL